MSLPNELKILYGVDTVEDLINKKVSGEKQIKASVSDESPRIVTVSEDECRKLCESVSFVYRPGYEKRIIERIVTTEAPDRDGDIIRAAGIDNKQYRDEPVVMFAHNKEDFPVGRSLKEWIDKKISGWRSWDMYFDNDIDTTGRSDLVYRMVASGAMRGGSIGFVPLEAKYDHSEEEKKRLGLGKYGVEYKRINKLEHSACSIPANQEALAAGLKSLDSTLLKKYICKEDLDTMEKQNVLDGNLIDVFSAVLGVKRTQATKTLPDTTTTGDNGTAQTINMVVDLSKITDEINTIKTEISSLIKSINDVKELYTKQMNSLIATADKLVSAIERKSSAGLYDRKDIADILKI